MKSTRYVCGMLAAAGAVLSAASAAAQTGNPDRYTALYVFGDSLVDAGNVQVATNGASPPPGLGYFDGRYTNGYNYVDYINARLFGGPTVASLKGGNNFGYGGARVNTNTDLPLDLAAQVSAYKARVGNAADPNALYILNFGANDIFALGRFGSGQDPNALKPYASPQEFISAIVSNYVGAVQSLNDLGARNILVTGIPNSTVPLAVQIDGQLQSALAGLTLDQTTNLYSYSYIDFFTRLRTNPGAFGLPALRTDTHCIRERAQATGCAGLLSFDGVHPTAAVQQALFRDIRNQFGITAVPEPQSWAMMIAGFAMAGAAVRRRAVRPATA